MTNKEPIIIGFDPGTTAAITAINTRGRQKLKYSSKDLKTNEITKKILETGKPILIATDKAKTPSKVQKISNSLGISVHTPKKDLGAKEKTELGEGQNDHEIDATAAAKKAYQKNQVEIQEAKEIAKNKNQETHEVLKKYFKGQNIRNKQNKKEKDNSNNKKEQENSNNRNQKSKNEKVSKELFERKKRKISNLEEQITSLQQEKESIKQENQKLKSKLAKAKTEERKEILKNQEIRKKDAKIKGKNEEIDKLEEVVKRFKSRETKYKQALEKILDGNKLVRKIENIENVSYEAVTTDSNLKNKDSNLWHIDDVQGVELPNYFVITSRDNDIDIKSLFEDYKRHRKGEL